jgi:formylglycine-generating enzyme
MAPFGGSDSTAGTSGSGGRAGTTSTTSACETVDDCMFCQFPSAPTGTEQCYCHTGCPTPTAMSKHDCAMNARAWIDYCAEVPMSCPTTRCSPLWPLACHHGGCVAAPGTGGIVASGGMSPTGGSAANGGATGAGGATGSAGAGCSGSYEAVELIDGHPLCVAKMVTIRGKATDGGGTDYQIDATEVTRGQYRSWLGTNPALPASQDPSCGWKYDWSDPDLGTAADGDGDHHPMAGVDWCDAYWYCEGVGKRLCGRISGGSNDDVADVNVAGIDQWYTACSSNGAYDGICYPYGKDYSATACNGVDAAKGGAVAVATMTGCQSSVAGYQGIFDLSGNVLEWEDACDGHAGMMDGCRIRGGGFDEPDSVWLSCEGMVATNRFVTDVDLGFRCCSRAGSRF